MKKRANKTMYNTIGSFLVSQNSKISFTFCEGEDLKCLKKVYLATHTIFT